MSAGFIPDEGLAQTLLELLGAAPEPVLPWELMFWTNDFEPTPGVKLGDLVEATFQGYTRLALLRENWTPPTVNDGCAHSTWGTDPVKWTVTGGPVETIYGYAYVDVLAGVLRFVQRFDSEDIAPIIVPGAVYVLPEYTLTSAECES